MSLRSSHRQRSRRVCGRRRVATFAFAGFLALVSPAAIVGVRLLAQAPSGPDATSSTTDDATGTVAAVSAATVNVIDKRGPFTYRLGSDLHVIGPDGVSLTIRDVHPGQEVTVYYYLRDGQPTVARIAVLKGNVGKDKDH